MPKKRSNRINQSKAKKNSYKRLRNRYKKSIGGAAAAAPRAAPRAALGPIPDICDIAGCKPDPNLKRIKVAVIFF